MWNHRITGLRLKAVISCAGLRPLGRQNLYLLDSPQHSCKQGEGLQVQHDSFSKLFYMQSGARQCSFIL